MAIKWQVREAAGVILAAESDCKMWSGRLLGAWLVTFAVVAAVAASGRAEAQANFDRPGGDYQSSPVTSGDPADCGRSGTGFRQPLPGAHRR